MNPVVSIVVAVYNAEDCLSRCLTSLILQTYKNIEIICVNDASTDKSQLIIDDFIAKDSRVRSIVHKVNTNAGGAMNDGIRAACGEYVCIVDNDDWLDSSCLETLLMASEGNTVDIISCDWYKYHTESDKKAITNLSNSNDKTENVLYSLLYGWRLLGCLIRRSIFVSNTLFFPENVFYEDNAIDTCILCYANAIKPVHIPLYYYCYTPGSVTRSVSKDKVIDRMKTTEMFLRFFTDRGFMNIYDKGIVEYRYLLFSNNTLTMLVETKEKWTDDIINELCKRIVKRMPNPILEQYHPELVKRLSAPHKFYNRQKKVLYIKRLIPSFIKKCIS